MSPRRVLLLGLPALLVVLVLLVFAFRGPIAVRLVERALERNIGRDAVAELPDGLHVLLCGAGSPLPDPRRSGPCVAVVAGETLLVVDAGTGGARNLGRLGLPAGRVDAVLLTHFHSDHIDGLGELAMLRWTGGARTRPLPLFGPAGVEDVAAGFNRAYGSDARYRTAHHGDEVAPAAGAGLESQPFALPEPGREVTIRGVGDLRVNAFAVDHDPVEPAVGYRFDYGGRSVVLSGDTAASEEVERMAKGVDLLVHEALSPKLVGLIGAAAERAGRDNIAKIARDILDYHTTPVEAASIAERAGARHLLFYHVVPPLPLPGLAGVFLEGVGQAYRGGVTLGEDGTTISLPSGSDAIVVESR